VIEVDLIELPGGGMIEVSHGAGEVLRAGFEVEPDRYLLSGILRGRWHRRSPCREVAAGAAVAPGWR
jgi:hypothetical protein